MLTNCSACPVIKIRSTKPVPQSICILLGQRNGNSSLILCPLDVRNANVQYGNLFIVLIFFDEKSVLMLMIDFLKFFFIFSSTNTVENVIHVPSIDWFIDWHVAFDDWIKLAEPFVGEVRCLRTTYYKTYSSEQFKINRVI